jgi:hypothetical protein
MKDFSDARARDCFSSRSLYRLHFARGAMMFRTIKFTDQGKMISGLYYVHNKQYPLVTAVTADGRQKTTQVGGSPPEVAARRLLIEMENEAARDTGSQPKRGHAPC